MANKLLTTDAILQRTAAGVQAIAERTPNIPSKLRAVLFLIDGSATLGDLLDRAGSLANLLETQVEELARRGLIEARLVQAAICASVRRPRPMRKTKRSRKTCTHWSRQRCN